MVGEGLASLYELQTIYSMEDLLNMAEIIIVNRHNEHMAAEHSQKS